MKDAEVGPKTGGTAMSWRQKPESARSRERVPPGQTPTTKFPILHVSEPPVFSPHTWMLKLVGEVEHPLMLTWEQVLALPSITSISDFHCVTSWSRLDNRWEGVAFRTLVEWVQPKTHAQ
jgi:DMSO/TMAO reductase YedYZ molybdopterin-dependent catalytic subunit